MTLAELRGGVMLRLGPREAVGKLVAAVDIELHNAIDDIRAQAKRMYVETMDRIARINVVADQDVYDWPEDAEEIRNVFWGGFGALEQTAFADAAGSWWWTDCGYAYACLTGAWGGYGWTQLPGRQFRILGRGRIDHDNAILVRYFPGHKRMVKPEDEPWLPRVLHENLIPRAIVKMASYEGIGLSHPRSFEIYRQEMQERLEDFLSPDSVSGSANRIENIDENYPGGL